MKIQTRTTILFTILTSMVFGILTFTVYYFSNKFVYNDFYKRLELRARISAKFTFEQGHVSIPAFKEIQKQYLEKLPNEESYVVKLSSEGIPLPPVPTVLPLNYLAAIRKANGPTIYNQEKFTHYAGLLYKTETGNYLVIESAMNSYGNDIITRLGYILLITLVVSVMVIYSVGSYLSRKTFRPFMYISNQMKMISDGNLDLRLEQQQGADEINELIKTFNMMLDRLSIAFEAQNNFVSNASHELRTPLTTIVAEADYALSRERPIKDYQESLQNIGLQAEKLQQLTKGLLSMAQIGFDGKKQHWEQFRLEELLFSVKANIDAIVENSHVVIHLPQLPANEEDIKIYGNQQLLKIALDNIVLNACKYSNNDTVLVKLNIINKKAFITVTDKGIGIPENEIKYIYDSFFRASNAVSFEGFGIGMSLSRNIIQMHRGEISLQSTLGEGTVVTITLSLL